MRIPVLGIVTAIWQRHELTDIVLGHLATVRNALAGRIDLRLAAAGSEGATSRTLAKKHGFAYVEVKNSPLGHKWNAALNLLRGSDIDGISCIGSDDLINEAYFHTVADALARGEKLFGLDSFFIMDRISGRLCHWLGYAPPRDKEPIGLGRFIHREYLEALEWRLWDDARHSGLDGNARARIAAVCAAYGLPGDFGFIRVAEHGIVPVDIKTAQQMWSYESMVQSAYAIRTLKDPRAFLASYYPPHIVDRVFAPCATP